MNIRNFYLVGIVLLSLGLLYEWNSEQKSKSINKHFDSINILSVESNKDFVTLESDELSLVISISSGSIVESRLKKYPVENVDGSLGFRVFGFSDATSFKYYFKSGFTGVSPSFIVKETDDNYVLLEDPVLGVSKKNIFFV